MNLKIEIIKEYLKVVESYHNKYTIAEYLKYINERFDIDMPPKFEMFKICKDIGYAIYLRHPEIDFNIKDKNGCFKNYYPEHILAKELFKEILNQK